MLVAVAALLTLPALPTIWTLPRAGRGAVGAAAAFLDVAEMLGAVIAGPLGWLDNAWTQDADGSAQRLLGEPWIGTGADTWTLVLLTAGACLVAWRLRSALGVVVAGALGTATALVLPIALDVPYLLAVLAYVGTGAVLLALASRVDGLAADPGEARSDGAGSDDTATTPLRRHRSRQRPGHRHREGLGRGGRARRAGGLALALGLAWSLAARAATPWALALTIAGALGAYAVSRRPATPAALVGAALAVVAETFVLARLAGAGPDRAGFAAVVAGCALGVLAGYLPRVAERGPVQLGAAFGAGCAFLPVATDPGWAAARAPRGRHRGGPRRAPTGPARGGLARGPAAHREQLDPPGRGPRRHPGGVHDRPRGRPVGRGLVVRPARRAGPEGRTATRAPRARSGRPGRRTAPA